MEPQLSTHHLKRQYSPNGRKVTQLLFAGLVASIAQFLLAYVSSNVGGMALTAQFLVGTLLLPFIEDYLADRQVLPTVRWLKGATWGAALWLFGEAVIAPLLGWGLFSHYQPNAVPGIFLAFVRWVVYGLVFDGVTRVRLVHELNRAT